ncbi:hypothetical protein [Hymenobacter negativus]|uniref:Outer membrane protein beta-barrel domain-containing protein n=1 Tax=Hymenobacter negativus TaxID=2795026 RepID=A0ABS0Q4Q6_9BACT|nr:hypothetical protein [Hymenobacter negativus]MBH8557328.1 hypothetical protein [Hymenobacter negativus]
MKRIYYLLPALLSSPVQAQPTASTAPAPFLANAWYIGLGVGNGAEIYGGYHAPHWLAYGRLRGKWWGPDKEPKAHLFGDDVNTSSRQTEVAALLGVPVAAGRSYFYAAAGVAYVSGRQLGEYRYSVRKSGLLSSDATHYYAYRDYQAIGLPLELGWQSAAYADGNARFGLVGQVNLNPQHSVFCLLATVSVRLSPLRRADL